MDQIREQVNRARRRLWIELFVNRLVRCVFASLFIAALAIGAPKAFEIEGLPANWTLVCGIAGLVLGFLAALAWTLWRGRTELDAAVEIDRRFDLRERVASSLSLTAAEIDTPAGQALLADAQRAVKRVDIDERFRLRLKERAWLPLVPALMVFVLASLNDRVAESSVDPTLAQQAQEQRKNVARELRKRQAELKKEASKKGLKETEGLFSEMEKETEKLAKVEDADHKKALVKLNDLAKQLEERREKLGGEKELRQQFQKMSDLSRGPADKMFKAMQEGKWQQAMQELQKLKKQLDNGNLDEQAKKDLEQQFKQLQEKMAQAAQDRQEAMDQLKKQIEQEKQQGNLSKAGELQQKLDQMQQQQQKMNQMNQLAQKMAECQQCMSKGDSSGASEALSQMMQQMEQLQSEMSEGEMLDMAMDQLQMAKDAMGCKACQGNGCSMCQGSGQGRQGSGFGKGRGNGMGAGQGFGPRPDEKNDTRFRNSRVRQNDRKGAVVITGEADGPNRRGAVVESIKEQMEAAESAEADPLVVEQLPKSHREHAEEYFNRFREGE